MSLIEDAQKINAATMAVEEHDGRMIVYCSSCSATHHETADFPHEPDCLFGCMPRTVAALEAAEAYLAPGAEGGGSLARLQALEAALRPEAVTV